MDASRARLTNNINPRASPELFEAGRPGGKTPEPVRREAACGTSGSSLVLFLLFFLSSSNERSLRFRRVPKPGPVRQWGVRLPDWLHGCQLLRAVASRAWHGFVASLVVLNSLLCAAGIVAVVFHFRYMRPRRLPTTEVNALLIVVLSSIFGILTSAFDPFRFRAASAGRLTVEYYSGVNLFSNFSLSLILAGEGFITAQWLSVFQRDGKEWTSVARIVFWLNFCCSILFAVGSALLRLAWVHADYLFFAYLGVSIIALSLAILIPSVRVLQSLQNFAQKNRDLTKRVAVRAVTVALLALLSLLIVLIVGAIPSYPSFYAFTIVRFFIPQLMAFVWRVVIIWYYRPRDHPTTQETSSDYQLLE